MRARLFLAIVLVLGFVARGAPAVRVSADQNGMTVVGANCVQDFPTAASLDPRATVVMCGSRQINQMFVVSADGGEPVPLTAEPSANGHPAWSRGRAVKP
jgi:hypothetical protein